MTRWAAQWAKASRIKVYSNRPKKLSLKLDRISCGDLSWNKLSLENEWCVWIVSKTKVTLTSQQCRHIGRSQSFKLFKFKSERIFIQFGRFYICQAAFSLFPSLPQADIFLLTSLLVNWQKFSWGFMITNFL